MYSSQIEFSICFQFSKIWLYVGIQIKHNLTVELFTSYIYVWYQIVQLRNEMSVITATATSLKRNTMKRSAMQRTFVELSTNTDIRRQIHKHTHVHKSMHKLHLDMFCNEIKRNAKNMEYMEYS